MIKTKYPQVYTGTGSAIENYNQPKKQLENIVKGVKPLKKNWGFFNNRDPQHKAVLSHLRTLQKVVPCEKWGEVADIKWLGEFLQSDKSPVQKPLKKMNKEEVSKIISCLGSMVTKQYK
jgi:hypothetical protein